LSDLVFLPAYQLAKGIRDRTFSSVEVLEAHLAQIAKHNPKLNAIVTLNEERALKRAKEADEALNQGEIWGPLHGVPVTFKDLFETEGLRTTFSYKPLADYIPCRNAPIVSRLLTAGAIILGKTNLPSQGADFQTHSPVFGRTNNPWNLSYTSGGSTGGGAVAVAAGLSPLEVGNDSGGSIRIPAHFCGVFGLKPTEHRVSTSLLGRPRSLRHLLVSGPLARSVEDLRLCLSLLEGADGWEWEVPPVTKDVKPLRPLKEYRFAWTDSFGGIPISTDTQIALEKFAVQLAAEGCQVERCNPVRFDFAKAWQTYGEICACEIGIKQSTAVRVFGSSLARFVPSSLIPGGPIVKGFVRGATLSMQRYMEALTQRDDLTRMMEQFLSKWDAWICPVTPGPAFTHRQTSIPLRGTLEVDEQKLPYWMWGLGHTSIFNLTGNPVVVVPISQSSDGLPIGIQIVSKRWSDMELLGIAEMLSDQFAEQTTGMISGFQQTPGY
jgi:amidase